MLGMNIMAFDKNICIFLKKEKVWIFENFGIYFTLGTLGSLETLGTLQAVGTLGISGI